MRTAFCKYHRREELLCKAHILPNAFYRYLRKRGADGFWLNKSGSDKVKCTPGGLYDKNILCSAADNQIGQYDKYGMVLFKEEFPGTAFVDAHGREWARIENLDVGLMNLFLLSYIWRCHHSQLEPFRAFDIGPTYEERIRQKLIDQDRDPVSWFSYMITMTYGDIDKIIMPLKFPFQKKIDGVNFIFLYFFNFKIVAKLDSRKNFDWFNVTAAVPGRPVVIPLQAYHESSDYAMECQSLRELLATGASW